MTSKLWLDILRRGIVVIIAALGAIRFIWTFVPSGANLGTWEIVLIGGVVLLGVIAIALDIRETMADLPKLCVKQTEENRINEYMCHLLRHGGGVAIFSKDLTWVSGSPAVTDLLREKAAKSQVTLILPKRNGVSDDLEAKGASVIAYPALGVAPKTRFTMLFHGDLDERIAVGRVEKGMHVIREYAPGETPFALAHDLIEIVKSCSQKHT